MNLTENQRKVVRVMSYAAIVVGVALFVREWRRRQMIKAIQERIKHTYEQLKSLVTQRIKAEDKHEEKLDKIADAMENIEKSRLLDRLGVAKNDQHEMMAAASYHLMNDYGIEYPKFDTEDDDDMEERLGLEQRRPWRRRWRYYWGRPWRNQWWWNRRLYSSFWNQVYNPYAGFMW